MPKKEAVNQIPPKLLQVYQTKYQQPVLVYAQADMNCDCEFQWFHFFLTKTECIIAMQPEVTHERVLSGYGVDIRENAVKDPKNLVWRSIPVENIANPYITNLVVGGLFHFEINGEDTKIAAFTNTYTARMKKLVEILKVLTEKKEITQDMLTEESREDFCPKCGTVYAEKDRKICPKCMDKRSIFFRLFEYFKPYKGLLILLVVLCVFNALMNALWPYLSGTLLYDKVLSRNVGFVGEWFPGPDGIFTILLLLALTMLVAKTIQQVFGVIQGRIVAKVVPGVVCNLKNQVFKSIQSLSLSFFASRQTGGLMTRILDDAGQVSGIFIDGMPYIIPNFLTIVFSCVVMFTTNWQLALISVIMLPFLVVISVKMQPRLWHFFSKQHQANRNLRAQLNDNIVGARVVKAFGQQDVEIQRFDKVNTKVRQAQMNVVGFDTKFMALYRFVEIMSVVLVWGFGSMYVLNFMDIKMSYGTLVTFVGYVSLLAGPLDFFSHIFRWWSNSMNSAQRIFEIIDSKADVVETLKPVEMDKIKGEIKMEHVSFEYEANKPILKDISLDIEAGKMLGIVGKSGAGKSTLVNLITRLYDPQKGNIYIDGVNIRDMRLLDVRQNVAMVSQETYIFRGTVFDNIAYANPECSRKEVIQAAVAAGAHDFICKMPDGYDTFVGSGGRTLSGGERQRVSIARAILANPKILILDEATAAVDTETERKIQAALEKLIVGKTTISIAHRISTLKNADKLIVIEDGKITERGTHKELIQQKGTYFKLLQIQSKALAMRGVAD